MEAYQETFIRAAIDAEALAFGEFTLKSGRVSPYFFNAGRFDTGPRLDALAEAYAAAIVDWGVEFDLLLGPAYKGIPLGATVAVALARRGIDVGFAYTRKEAKGHGEGGRFVGAPLGGRVLIIDDVITAGTAIREVLGMLEPADVTVAGVIVALDRQERGQDAGSTTSAIQELERVHSVAVRSIVSLETLLNYTKRDNSLEHRAAAMAQYQDRYGAR